MLPHPRGESDSIANAFHECSLALHRFDKSTVDDTARGWLDELEQLMDTTGLQDPTGSRGLWAVKADSFTVDDMIELSRIIDELAHWFSSERPD